MAKNAAAEGALGTLHSTLAKVLTDAINAEGGAPAAILAVAAKFLKDNDITCAADKANAMGELTEAMEAARAPVSDKDKAQALDGVLDLAQYRAGHR